VTTIVDLELDVTDVAGLGQKATMAVTVHMPDPAALAPTPIVCFAKPGAGYSRHYFTRDLPGPASGAQAEWHAERGWVFVAVDHLGVGGSTIVEPAGALDYSVLSASSLEAESQILDQLSRGVVDSQFPALSNPVTLGIGQSMGGAVTIAQQGRFHCYDGIAVLGFSAMHTHPPAPPGGPLVAAWRARDVPDIVLNRRQYDAAARTLGSPEGLASIPWQFFFDETEAVAPTSAGRADGEKSYAPWISPTMPGGVLGSVLTPGVLAPEAAAVDCPVLVAMGERDSLADPRGELRAYLSAPSVDFFVCPRMAHMHNFAATRELFWKKLGSWGEWVASYREELLREQPAPRPLSIAP
jgi:alpha-beta hydrolase superfamily lysophospholipase